MAVWTILVDGFVGPHPATKATIKTADNNCFIFSLLILNYGVAT
jgi:hypothetical protein